MHGLSEFTPMSASSSHPALCPRNQHYGYRTAARRTNVILLTSWSGQEGLFSATPADMITVKRSHPREIASFPAIATDFVHESTTSHSYVMIMFTFFCRAASTSGDDP